MRRERVKGGAVQPVKLFLSPKRGRIPIELLGFYIFLILAVSNRARPHWAQGLRLQTWSESTLTGRIVNNNTELRIKTIVDRYSSNIALTA